MANEDWNATIGHQMPKNPTPWKKVASIRHRNTEYLRGVIEKIGWPSKKIVGEETSHWAWYIAQHSDHDLPFQENCLSLMEAIPKKEVSLYDLAHLTDRVRLAKNLKQLYGTQYRWDKEGNLVYAPLEDPEGLSRRREEMGLNESFQSHHERVTKTKL